MWFPLSLREQRRVNVASAHIVSRRSIAEGISHVICRHSLVVEWGSQSLVETMAPLASMIWKLVRTTRYQGGPVTILNRTYQPMTGWRRLLREWEPYRTGRCLCQYDVSPGAPHVQLGPHLRFVDAISHMPIYGDLAAVDNKSPSDIA